VLLNVYISLPYITAARKAGIERNKEITSCRPMLCIHEFLHPSFAAQSTRGQRSETRAMNTVKARKHRQSYRHADPRRQQQHTAVAACVTSNRATVMVFVTVWPWPLTFWPLGQCIPSDYYEQVYSPNKAERQTETDYVQQSHTIKIIQ